jgi:ATP-binding cassette subfamily B protein
MFSKSVTRKAIFEVLAFLFRHWKRRPGTVVVIAVGMAAATVADLLLPVYSGRLVDAVASSGTSRVAVLDAAKTAVAWMVVLGALLIAGITEIISILKGPYAISPRRSLCI